MNFAVQIKKFLLLLALLFGLDFHFLLKLLDQSDQDLVEHLGLRLLIRLAAPRDFPHLTNVLGENVLGLDRSEVGPQIFQSQFVEIFVLAPAAEVHLCIWIRRESEIELCIPNVLFLAHRLHCADHVELVSIELCLQALFVQAGEVLLELLQSGAVIVLRRARVIDEFLGLVEVLGDEVDRILQNFIQLPLFHN